MTLMDLQINNISFRYHEKDIIKDISFRIPESCVLGLIGPNGTGKTTLIKAISGILKPYEGTSLLDGKNLLKLSDRSRAQYVSYVPQSTGTVFAARVVDTVMMGRKPFQRFTETEEDRRIAFSAMETMEVSQFAFQDINALSGGERQRVFIARALCQQPKLLLLDEPTSSMDLKNQLRTMKLVRELADNQKLIVIVSIHDINLAAMYCTEFLLLDRGKIMAMGSADAVLTSDHIRSVYGIQTDFSDIDGCRHMIMKKI